MIQLNNLRKYPFSSKICPLHIQILLVFSIVLFCVAGIIDVPGVLTSPQFATNFEPGFIKEVLAQNNWHFEAYKAYFIIDCLWAAIFLLAIVKSVRYNVLKSRKIKHARTWLTVFGFLALAAYGFDLAENYSYYFQYSYPRLISNLKNLFYIILLGVWLTLLIYRYKDDIIPTLKDFFKSAWISLIILVIIGSVLPQAPQVNSIVVNLYDYPVNFIALLLFAPIYAVILAHNPSYFNIKGSHRTWYRAEKYKLWIFGTIFYKYKDGFKESRDGRTEGIVNFFFRIIGVLFYAALFYLIAYTSEVNFNWPLSMNEVTSSLVIVGIFLLFYHRKIKNKWLNANILYLVKGLPNFYDGDITLTKENKDALIAYNELSKAAQKTYPVKAHESLYDIKKFVWWYLIFFLLTVILHVVLVIFLYKEHYTNTTAWLSLVCIIFQLFTFIYYRTYRSVFRFAFYTPKIRAVLNAFYFLRVFNVTIEDKVTQTDIDDKEAQIKSFFLAHPKFATAGFFRWIGFGAHSNNIFFLQFTVTIGLLNTAILLYLNVFSDVTLDYNINAILIILSSFFLYYGIVIVLTKNLIYYRFSNEVYAKNHKHTYYRFLVISFLIVGVIYGFTRANPNELFTLSPVKTAQSQDSILYLDAYVKALPNDASPRYYIGAYGGGMKANAWTLTVLNELYSRDSHFFDHTIAMSGASGGTIGIINMAAIIHQKATTPSQWADKIREISTENILSLDLTHILGRDTFNRMFLPGKWFPLHGLDRSSKAMYRYGDLVHGHICDYMDKSFQDYWYELYKKRNNRFPILIANTTNVRGNHGMAVSVKVKPEQEQHSFLFQGADNVLDLGTRSLSYYDAASTSNRFPVISPAAKIETKGFYNDGGIFENSGLLSAFKTFRAVNALDTINDLDDLKQVNVFISIVNDKNQYIKHYLKKCFDTIRVKKINRSTEIDAILNSVSSTEMMPIFVKNELQRLADRHDKIKFESIYLPHQFTVEDVFSILGKELEINKVSNKDLLKRLYECVQQNNSDIARLIKGDGVKQRYTPIVEPPMSRVLADAAYTFMVKMLKHGAPSEAMDEILR